MYTAMNNMLAVPPTPTSPTYNLRKRKAEAAPPVAPDTSTPLTKRFRKLNLSLRDSPPQQQQQQQQQHPYTKVIKRIPSRSTSLNSLNSIKEPWNLVPPPFPRPASPPPTTMAMGMQPQNNLYDTNNHSHNNNSSNINNHNNGGGMEVDDTPHRIILTELDMESSDDDPDSPPRKNSANNPIIFLSDVEREMTRIPSAVLKVSTAAANAPGFRSKLPTARSGGSTDLILYRPPERVVSIDCMERDGGVVPIAPAEPNVRRLIIEARERMRRVGSGGSMEDIKSASISMGGTDTPPHGLHGNGSGNSMGGNTQLGVGITDSPMSFMPTAMGEDPDAMLLDDDL